jgi:hypothetical protein
MNYIDIEKRLIEEICTFDIAKQCFDVGVTAANTFLAYDEKGSIGDGGWMHDLGYKMYRAINFTFAVMLIKSTEIEVKELIQVGSTCYWLYTDDNNIDKYESTNIVDVLLMAYIDYKKNKK